MYNNTLIPGYLWLVFCSMFFSNVVELILWPAPIYWQYYKTGHGVFKLQVLKYIHQGSIYVLYHGWTFLQVVMCINQDSVYVSINAVCLCSIYPHCTGKGNTIQRVKETVHSTVEIRDYRYSSHADTHSYTNIIVNFQI